MKPGIIGLLVAVALLPGQASAAEPLGVKPGYTEKTLSQIANDGAVSRRIWAPGLDQGYVPQGVTYIDGALFMSAYHSTSKAQSKGPCRLYRLNPETGVVTGTLDLPASCGHAGGLARGAAGQLVVADTRHVYLVQLAAKGDPKLGTVMRTIGLKGDVRGSFAAGDGTHLWLGTYKKDDTGKLYKFALAKLGDVVDESSAAGAMTLPLRAQGAAMDGAGRLWVSQSSGGMGLISVLDQKSGKLLQRYATAIGVEDLSFDAAGHLWTVSEAGSQRWLGWHQFFPVLYRLDISRLKE